MKITVLGSGSPEPHVRRASSGYLVEIGDDKILLDCGGGVFDNLLRAGHLPQEITHLFFSHLHSDHMMDYARLVHAAWDAGATPLKVWGPAPIARITDGYFGPDGVLAHDLKARTQLMPSKEVWKARGGTLPRPWPAPEVSQVTPGFSIQHRGWHLSMCEVPHAQPFLTCMAIRIEAEGRVFVYSGDAGLTSEFELFCNGADLLIHWCYRLDSAPLPQEFAQLSPKPEEIAAMAARAQVCQLVLTHIRKEHDTDACHNAAMARASGAGLPKVSIAEDLQVFDFARSR